MLVKRKTTTAKHETRKAKPGTTKLKAMGSQIMTMAKKIRNASPTKKWTTCVKEAGKAYKRSK